MCGICGFNFEDKALLKNMCNLIIHRGPDDVGFYTDSEVSIGIRRLSIIDLNTGNQPQHNENNDIWIVYNGELFNFMDLKEDLLKKGHRFYTESDTEVIIHAYEEWGLDCVKKFNGEFAFCIYDSKKKKIVLFRDHLGIKPLYYFFNGNKFIFGSEIKPILLNQVERIVNKRAFNYYIGLKYVPFNLTLFENIYKVPPSSILIFDLKSKSLEIKKYWKALFNINNNRNESSFAKELRDALKESIKKRLMSDVPLGVFLSGGLDSSSIVALMSEINNNSIKTFSIGFLNAPVNETKYSRLIADKFNTDHTEIIINPSFSKIIPELVWYLDDLISDAAIIPVHLMAKYAREKMKVALTGDGADELFGGYSVYYNPSFSYIKHVPQSILDYSMKFYNYIPFIKLRSILAYLNHSKDEVDRYISSLLTIPEIELAKILPFEIEDIRKVIKNYLIDYPNILNKFTYWDINYQLPNQYNMKTDKMCMATSLEPRIPFLDKNIVELALKIPPALKRKNNIEKYILKLAMKDLLPKEIIKRRKQGFGVPINLWLRNELKDFSHDILKKLEKHSELINPYFIKKLRNNIGNKSYIYFTWNLIMFELWYETFIMREKLAPLKTNEYS